jgi:hypothetical protein
MKDKYGFYRPDPEPDFVKTETPSYPPPVCPQGHTEHVIPLGVGYSCTKALCPIRTDDIQGGTCCACVK